MKWKYNLAKILDDTYGKFCNDPKSHFIEVKLQP